MVVSAIVEHIRRTKAIEQGFRENPSGVVNMSAYWLVPQHVLSGLGEAFNSIAQTEFYYSEFPNSMSSIASAMFGLGMAFANLLASAILSTGNNVSSKGGKESWTSSNINKGHFESYYWLLAITSSVNLFYYLVCSWAYGPCVEQWNGFRPDDKKGSASSEEELLQLFVLRAESELQTVMGDNHAHNMACLDSIKAQMGCLFGNSTPRNTQAVPETRENQHPRDEIFSPRMIRNKKQTGTKYRGDWLKRPVSNDEIAWLAKLLVTLSCWLNEKLGLNQSGTTDNQGAAWSYVEVSGGTRSVNGPADTMKVVFLSVVFWLISVIRATVKLMRDHGMKVNLRILASKKIMISLLMLVAFSVLKRAVSQS
ncbi:hypothetical protein DCAR_0205506 [Daucus carota subsp. sativus]|uniref:Uncharacterized protein n=1 Tax=Daucus carota subsp. sativus TaxID=79200 RepID=A0A166CNN2_DAUCS|nr:hypothetical protein DCAR_0205506 [Daucus carota subsp. sativus]